jgi:hypothetical protein
MGEGSGLGGPSPKCATDVEAPDSSLKFYLYNSIYMDGRSQIKVHTDERKQVHSAQSSLAVTHPGTNRT